MSNPSLRLLGFAFAAADLLIEIDDKTKVVFAAGAMADPAEGSAQALVGRTLGDIFAAGSAAPVEAMLRTLQGGRRGGPAMATVKTAGGALRRASVRAFGLPELAPHVSCAITFEGPLVQAAAPDSPVLMDPDAFAQRVRKALERKAQEQGQEQDQVGVSLLEIRGLHNACQTLSAEKSGALMADVERALQAASVEGNSASRVTDERYAVLTNPGAAPSDLTDEVRRIATRNNVPLQPTVAATALEPGTDPMAGLRAMRLTLDSFLREGPPSQEALSTSFGGAVRQTLTEAKAFVATVRERNFELNFQPVVALETGRVDHYECLSRFRRDTSPAPVIRMAEDMELIRELDLVVAEMALARLRRGNPDDLKLAINVSGQSMTSDTYVERLLQLTSADPGERRRMTLEITESAALAEPEVADVRIQHLRKAGFRVSIDDFGSGAASLEYLRKLSVDEVKIDGRYVREVATDPRARKMVGHLSDLCASLGLSTVAEMVETQDCADALREMGVGFGQGWLFGRPSPQPQFIGKAPVARPVGRAVAGGRA